MNILFITLADIVNIDEYGIYTDLLREFYKNGHNVFIVSPTECRNRKNTQVIKAHNCTILKVKTGNIQKTHIIEKGISTVLLESQFVAAIKKYYCNVKFDLILYSTPPITIAKSVQFIKKRDNARTYLLLKDIFPQNAVDLGMMKKTGLKSPIYWYFRLKEKKLYSISDGIGCMSQANVDYVLKHNRYIPKEIVEICPNSVEIRNLSVTDNEKKQIREKYKLPLNKKIFVYGGNLGKPQDVPFILDCIKSCTSIDDAFFLIVGNGTDSGKVVQYIESESPSNFKYMAALPREEYDKMIAACDVGLLFLDNRFTIPNFPSRLLSYMQVGLPILAATDKNTDVGKIIVENGLGWWCESDDVYGFIVCIKKCLICEEKTIRNSSYEYLYEHYSVEGSYNTIMVGEEK